MPIDSNSLALDERTARIGRELFAQVRQKQRDAAAEEKRCRSERTDGSDGGLWDALIGDGGGDSGDSGD